VLPINRRRRKPKKVEPDMSSWSEHERTLHALTKKTETPVAELPTLSVRTVNGLEVEGIIVCAALLKKSHNELISIKNFGDKTVIELRVAVKALGLNVPTIWNKPRTKVSRGGNRSAEKM
jgi:DNA-directed RNA polymerase alpha subunit